MIKTLLQQKQAPLMQNTVEGIHTYCV